MWPIILAMVEIIKNWSEEDYSQDPCCVHLEVWTDYHGEKLAHLTFVRHQDGSAGIRDETLHMNPAKALAYACEKAELHGFPRLYMKGAA